MARISKGQLEKLQKKYKTDDAIGKLFGISRQAVHQLRQRYGILPVPDRHGERDREIARAHQEGLSGTRIARRFKISPSQVYRVLRKGTDQEGLK